MKSPRMYRLLALSLLLGISGCAIDRDKTSMNGLGLTYQSKIKPAADGNFYVEAEAAVLAGRASGARKVVTDLAIEHCAKSSKKMTVIDLKEDSHLIVNGVARLTFRCD